MSQKKKPSVSPKSKPKTQPRKQSDAISQSLPWWRSTVKIGSIQVELFVLIGFIIVALLVLFLLSLLYPGLLSQLARNFNVPIPATQSALLPNTLPSAPTFDVSVANEHDNWNNPTAQMNINATKPITITIDPDGIHQATCSNWSIQPKVVEVLTKEGCGMTFYAITYKDTTVTVDVTVGGVIVSKTFVFHPR